MIPWLIGHLETSQKWDFSHRTFFSEMGTKKKTQNTMYFRHVYMTFVFNWESYVYSAAFLLFLLSEICEGQIGPLGVPHDIRVKIKCSHLYKHCFPIHLPGKSNPACVDDVTACSYANNLGVVSPVFRLPSYTKACEQWWTSLSLLLMGNRKCALRSY